MRRCRGSIPRSSGIHGAGTIRVIRDESNKDALHSHRALVSEWRPRMQGPETSAFPEYRRSTVGTLPLVAAIACEHTSLGDESVGGVIVDEAALAATQRGDLELLGTTERMILEWASPTVFCDEQLEDAVEVLDLVEERVGRGPS